MLPVICQTMHGILSTILALPCEVDGDTRGSGPQQEAEQNRLLQPNLGGGPRARRRRALGRLQVEDAPGSRFPARVPAQPRWFPYAHDQPTADAFPPPGGDAGPQQA